MSESSEYLANRAERKARAEKTMEANAKSAAEAKAKAQGKVKSASTKAFNKALEEKRANRAANYSRATSLPSRDELNHVAEED